ncbi:DUF202 domain-containing protein [Prescottella subtropica]|uniref:DUF202 domain-containing protein n=1 Tax=Prescottella subtropica TaxID=2545757 RepID=UPI0010F9B430|nr:DUF202 domain-containing protein [Prescottella subtropica]
MPPTADGHGDPGLQPERTTLAWVRTAASLAAVAFLCLRYVPGSSTLVQVVGVWAVVSASVVIVTARRRHQRVSEKFGAGRVDYPFLLVAGLAGTVVALAAASAAVVLATGR